MVFLHGWGNDRRMWDSRAAALAPSRIACGATTSVFGTSRTEAVPYSHATDLLAVMDALGLPRASVVGLSLGGGAAINFAIHHADRLDRLVLVDPSLAGFAWSDEFRTAWGRVYELAKTSDALDDLDPIRDAFLRHPAFTTGMASPAVAAVLRQMINDYTGWHWQHGDTGVSYSPPAIERLGEIRAATLVIVGEHDMPDFLAIADTLEAGIPSATRRTLAGAGHMANLEAPDAFNDALRDFLR